MANKLKVITELLAVVLIISLGVSLYLVNQNLSLTDERNTTTTQLEMNTLLSQGQVAAEAELTRIGSSEVYASQQLSTTGLQGNQAHAVLSALAANSTFIIDAGTQDLNSIMLAVEPSQYSNAEGKSVGEQKWLNPNPNGAITPCMTPVIPLIENMTGIAMASPVFVDGSMIGTVSVIFNPAELLNAKLAPLLQGKSYEFVVMQPNGQILYSTNPAEEGTNIFTDSSVAGSTELLTVWHQIADQSSGYGTYLYNLSGVSQVTHKECAWTTINAYGQQWRLTIIYALNA
ncbi:MAG: hypothetical protein NWF05_07915 [Candidatus Bathyarchaeota archaeon]|nr:hypothetical protein [Candidatus Bathyarchaeota archaeon]